jgi:hypothetical protein
VGKAKEACWNGKITRSRLDGGAPCGEGMINGWLGLFHDETRLSPAGRSRSTPGLRINNVGGLRRIGPVSRARYPAHAELEEEQSFK